MPFLKQKLLCFIQQDNSKFLKIWKETADFVCAKTTKDGKMVLNITLSEIWKVLLIVVWYFITR